MSLRSQSKKKFKTRGEKIRFAREDIENTSGWEAFGDLKHKVQAKTIINIYMQFLYKRQKDGSC